MPPRPAMSFSSESTSYIMTLSVNAPSGSAFSFATRMASPSMALRTSASSPMKQHSSCFSGQLKPMPRPWSTACASHSA